MPGSAAFTARTRGQAAELMQHTELFYRAAEPSSAIPLLLSKARSYVSKDFASILSELIPRDPDSN
jgi:type VI secretion system protein ImpA